LSAFVIARLTFREAARRLVLWVAVLLGLLFLLIYGLGMNEIHKDLIQQTGGARRLMISEIYNFFLLAGLYVANFMTIIMTVLTSIDTLSGEISSGTIHTLVSKPVRRWEIVLGKWMGFLVMLTIYLILIAGGVMLIVYMISGYSPPNPLCGFAVMWLNVLLLLGVSLMGGAVLSTLSNGVMVFGLYGVAFIGGWIEQIGSFLNNQTAINIGVLTSLLLPSEALWKRASYEMQSPAVSALGGVSPLTSQSVPSPLMIAYAALYAGAALWIAIHLFKNRDL
jgi:Cu-processing system permease protein